MAQNVFDSTNSVNNDITRNYYDWSHVNNMSGRLGYYYPVFNELVPPNFKFRCKADAGLQFMPMVFPVQTTMRTRMSFFKVPLRTLWEDYRDYVGNFRDDLVEPYIQFTEDTFKEMLKVGGLLDFQNVPNVLSGDSVSDTQLVAASIPFGFICPRPTSSTDASIEKLQVGSYLTRDLTSITGGDFSTLYVGYTLNTANIGELKPGVTYEVDMAEDVKNFLIKVVRSSSWPLNEFFDVRNTPNGFITSANLVVTDSSNCVLMMTSVNLDGTPIFGGYSLNRDGELPGTDVCNFLFNNQFSKVTFTCPASTTGSAPRSVGLILGIRVNSEYQNLSDYTTGVNNLTVSTTPNSTPYKSLPYDAIDQNSFGDYSLPGYENIPYATVDNDVEGADIIRLKAYKARAYEAVYNAYFRDNRNNPFYVDGKVQYNKWLPTMSGGADNTLYTLRRANWEKDFLTTAVPSPQQGIAPLVGLTSYTSTNSEGLTTRTLALVDEDGQKYNLRITDSDTGSKVEIGERISDSQALEQVSYRTLIEDSTQGISIPDLRIVNAYQRFLELNMRKGFSYKEIIEGRFDCNVSYDELLMPQFIGGWTRDVQMNRIVQSVETGSSGSYGEALGSLAGDAYLSTGGNIPEVSCFCDEESIIIGIMSVVPIPIYTQLLPKDYTYETLLDHFQPEFNHIGYQPITYKELCPLQAKYFNLPLSTTYGYQRPWYEYVQKYDTAHGLMKTQLRNFVMNRVFLTPPELSEDFLLVDDTQLNDVFSVTETSDKFVGQIYFNCNVESPVARVAIPRLD